MSWTLRIELLEGNYIYLLLFMLLTDCSDSLIYFMFIYFRGTKQLYGNQWMTIYLWIKVRLFQIKDREYRCYQKLTIPRTWQQDEKTKAKTQHNTCWILLSANEQPWRRGLIMHWNTDMRNKRHFLYPLVLDGIKNPYPWRKVCWYQGGHHKS